jgi:hypothetical protein
MGGLGGEGGRAGRLRGDAGVLRRGSGSGDRGRWPGACLGVKVARRGLVLAGGGGERLELLERGLERFGSWPGCGEVELAAPAGEREPGADVQQLVAQPFRFGFGELAVEYERLGPDDQVVREHHDLQPHFVERERFERELRQAGVFVVADAVLDPGALTVVTLDHGDIGVGLVGQDGLAAEAVVVGE